MPRISEIEDMPVTGRKGRLFGRVTHVLFAPTEARVVGLEVQPPAIGYIIDRRPRFLVFDAVERSAKGLAIREGSVGERPTFSWDESVVWRYMPVASEDGRPFGFVKDVEFDSADGAVRRLWLSRGAAEDAAVGGSVVDGAAVIGFDGEAVRLTAQTIAPTSGGAARQAGHGVAIAKIAAEETAKQAIGGAVEIAKAVRKSPITKRAASGWKAFRDSIAEGMNDEK